MGFKDAWFFFPLSFRSSWSHGWEDFCETPEFQITTEYIALDLMGKSENRYRSVNQVSECQAWAGMAVFTLGRIGCITNRAFSLFPLPSWLYGCLGVYYFNVFPWHLSFKKNQTHYFLHHIMSNWARWLSVNLHTKLGEKRGL